jgi:hypothetical protein
MLYRFGLYLTGEVELARETAQDTIRVALSKDWPTSKKAGDRNPCQEHGLLRHSAGRDFP